MNEPVDLGLERKIRGAELSDNLSPEDALRYALRDVQNGTTGINPTAAIVILFEESAKGPPIATGYYSNMTFVAEQAYLELYRKRRLSDWEDGA